MKTIVALCIAYACQPCAALAADHEIIDNTPEFIVKPATFANINQLRDGGYVLYMRHGNTDVTHPDRLPAVDLNDCATQRQLTEEGRHVASKVGKKIRKAQIPVGEIVSSPLCRTKETASIAFRTTFSVNNALMFTSGMTDKDKIPVIEATRELLSTPVEGKSNRVVVAHAQALMEIMGYLPSPEGTVVIFKPMGDKRFKYIATIQPSQWKSLKP